MYHEARWDKHDKMAGQQIFISAEILSVAGDTASQDGPGKRLGGQLLPEMKLLTTVRLKSHHGV